MKRLSFIPQLDSFRFFAVFLVLISHWIPKFNYLPWGSLGVTFFFVLSGYLISSNLLYLKESINNKEISIPQAFKLFYIRRTLRIFPLYYFAIILLYLLIGKIFEGNVIWYITYLPNILMYREKAWPGMLSHFWSLGVEEQFYLLWPLLIFSVKWDRLKYLFPFMIAVSITFKFIVYITHGSFLCTLLPWSNFDAFGIGAILAYLPFAPHRTALLEKIPFLWGFLTCTALSIVFQITGFYVLFGVCFSGSSFFIIRKAQKGFTGFAGAILNHPALQYLGKISYGLYVYHNFIPWLWRCLTGTEDRYPLPVTLFAKNNWLSKPVVALSAEFILLVGISSLSWFLLEKPFNNLKNIVGWKKNPSLTA